MGKWTKLNKIMSWCVMISGIVISIVLAIVYFSTAAGLSSSYYSNPLAAMYVWLGIGVLVIGSISCLGVFVLWNMFIDWYGNAQQIKRKLCGEPEPYAPAPMQFAAPVQQYAAPVQQPTNWQCPACGGINNPESGFCYNCGKPRQ